jgi:hypothetical protein
MTFVLQSSKVLTVMEFNPLPSRRGIFSEIRHTNFAIGAVEMEVVIVGAGLEAISQISLVLS